MRADSSGQVSVLVVEDSHIVRERICEMLNEAPHLRVVGQAASVAEALQVFEALRPHAVVLDYRLPDGTGLQILQHVKHVAPWCVVIVLTNLHEDMFGEICRAAGADYFFHKASEFERVPEVLTGLAAELLAHTAHLPAPPGLQVRPPQAPPRT